MSECRVGGACLVVALVMWLGQLSVFVVCGRVFMCFVVVQ